MTRDRPKTQIMAVLNVTPDSFSDGGRLGGLDALFQAAEVALTAGANILDVGGESTRPGAAMIPVDEELKRVMPAIENIRTRFPEAMISIDTRKAAVAKTAIQAGASIINDVSGLQFDPLMAETIAQSQARLVLMHSQGTPETMQQNPTYPQGVVPEILAFFERQMALAEQSGVHRERIIIDPGFGFGKTLQHNLTLLKQLYRFQDLGCPILVGTSRKSFLTLGNQSTLPNQREALTAASLVFGIQNGASYVRIHDAVTQVPVIRLIEQVLQVKPSS